ncbi:MAG: thioredoxin family protein [Flavobacterium sp. MedPE-SWcel]|uniref:thioredoxin family protein n=1 Tax=uncultured Flavobacterium sp. TaxID=165435 RepID=UPI000922D46A|nr:thioredoxin family protein [uncultured Flavobacterium sp.]OIQ21842.1 MAG: thioredoxin family protein [Flavobacterium sp. MedPE-SWcel]
MKKLLLVLFVALGSLTIQAQETLEWHTDIKEAAKLSEETKKPLLLFFTGSDWCGWCVRLQKEVLKTSEFEKWAKENVILVELDFPRRTKQSLELKQQNAKLNQFFKVRGYPTIWFANGSEKATGGIAFDALGSVGYVKGGPSNWLKEAKRILNSKK